MDTEVVEKSYDKLGFNEEEAGELVEALNLLLANYAVVYQKIRNFHWNVVGSDFFDVHEKLELEYTSAATAIDEVAERVRILGFRPLSTMAEFIEFSDIEETTETPDSDEIMKTVVEDYETLLSFMIDVADLAVEHGDLGSETMMRGMIQSLEKKHWMFSAYLSK